MQREQIKIKKVIKGQGELAWWGVGRMPACHRRKKI